MSFTSLNSGLAMWKYSRGGHSTASRGIVMSSSFDVHVKLTNRPRLLWPTKCFNLKCKSEIKKFMHLGSFYELFLITTANVSFRQKYRYTHYLQVSFIYIWWLLIQKMKSGDSVLKLIVVGERDTTIPTCVEAITDVMETFQVTNPL